MNRRIKLVCITMLVAALAGISVGLMPAAFAFRADNDHPEGVENKIFEELTEGTEKDNNFVKWMDFNVPTKVLLRTYELSKKYHNTATPLPFCEALAYLSVQCGNRFTGSKDLKRLDALAAEVKAGKTVTELMEGAKHFSYYLTCYRAVFRGITGERTNENGAAEWGLTGYFPLASGYWYSHYDDFGNSRSYGFKRRHLGHDMMGGVGTPVIAVEGGTVAELGWNQYGGWRIGIRSSDGQRYYYYAHLRKDHPYAAGIEKGASIEAGSVIGYLGQTGYSRKENVNLKTGKPHLHIGLQLIFDESQVDGNGEIWIDMYALTNLLARNKTKVERIPDTKEYRSVR